MKIKAVPFRVNVPEQALTDLRARLALTRWPLEPAVTPWRYGASLDYMKNVVDYWMNQYDWRKSEAAINRFPNYRAAIEGLEVHVIVEEGSGPNPKPLLLTHGWPGSIIEFLDVIEPLAHPERFGGAVEDAFTVIVPSIPGYGFSSAPQTPMTPRVIARLWNTLMTETLGFASYFAQGGDWGSTITSWMGYDYPERIPAMHLNLVAFDSIPANEDTTQEEKDWIEASRKRRDPEAGYRTQQGTKPQTLAYGLTDSPAGLAAWILEKFQGWTVPGEAKGPPFGIDHLLANVMLYWLPGPSAASWLYISLVENDARRLPAGQKVTVPTGFLLCPRDVSVPPPERVIKRNYNMARRTVAADGGHFLALEQGKLFVEDVRTFFRSYRQQI